MRWKRSPFGNCFPGRDGKVWQERRQRAGRASVLLELKPAWALHVPGGFLRSPPTLVSALQWGSGLVAGTDAKKQQQKQVIKDDYKYFSGACDRRTCLSSVPKGLKRM